MTAGVIGRLPRVGLIACAIGLVTGTIGYAASTTLTPPAAAPEPAAVAEPDPLVVPDVRKQAYVFAKGSLEQSGFAWRVEGSVPGYAANVVLSQSPAPGSRVIADGAPIVVLRLSRNSSYGQEGMPENASPYAGKAARLVGSVRPAAPKPARTTATAPPSQPAKLAATSRPKAAPKAAAAARTPAFTVAGAPAEPADEPLLSTRAKRLAAWVEKHPRRTQAAVSHWLYQHSWIVTGAGFGWAEGAAALRTLVAVDERVQELWGVGAASERQARKALAEVSARSR
jgi:hypothetical protein